MKKLVFIVALGVAACNENGKSAEKAVDSTVDAIGDSINNRNDSLKSRMDSVTDKKIDSIQAMADTTKKILRNR